MQAALRYAFGRLDGGFSGATKLFKMDNMRFIPSGFVLGRRLLWGSRLQRGAGLLKPFLVAAGNTGTPPAAAAGPVAGKEHALAEEFGLNGIADRIYPALFAKEGQARRALCVEPMVGCSLDYILVH